MSWDFFWLKDELQELELKYLTFFPSCVTVFLL